MKRLITYLLFLVFTLSFNVLASSFYTVKVVVDGQSKQAETLAKQQGFKDVLVRVSGKNETLSLPEIKTNLAKVDQYINQISYEVVDEKRVGSYLFDDRKLLTLLKKAKASFWELKRPNILFWLVNVENRRIIWAEYALPEIGQLQAAGVRRGLPVILPKGDIENIVSIDPNDLLGNIVSSIKQASASYEPQGVVVARIENNTLNWQLFPNFELMEEEDSIDGFVQNSSLNAINQMVDTVSEYYAATLAMNMDLGGVKPLEFKLNGIEAAADFFLVEKILKQLNTVASANLKSVIKDTITFDLMIYDNSDVFIQELTKYEQLEPISIDSGLLKGIDASSEESNDSEMQNETENTLVDGPIPVEVFTYQWVGYFSEEAL